MGRHLTPRLDLNGANIRRIFETCKHFRYFLREFKKKPAHAIAAEAGPDDSQKQKLTHKTIRYCLLLYSGSMLWLEFATALLLAALVVVTASWGVGSVVACLLVGGGLFFVLSGSP